MLAVCWTIPAAIRMIYKRLLGCLFTLKGTYLDFDKLRQVQLASILFFSPVDARGSDLPKEERFRATSARKIEFRPDHLCSACICSGVDRQLKSSSHRGLVVTERLAV